MERHPIQGLMDTSMQNIRDMVDVNTVLGDAIVAKDGSTILPVSKVSFGFVSGGGEYSDKDHREGRPFAGGAGAGVTIQPVGFLVCGDDRVRMLPAQAKTSADRVIDLLPGLMEELRDALAGINGKKKRGHMEPEKHAPADEKGPEEALPEVPAE